jgi:hypothetical protein
MNSSTIGIVGVLSMAVIIAAFVAVPAYAEQSNNQNNNQKNGNNQQSGVVNVGNVNVGANVGANVKVKCSVIASC